MKVQTLAAVAFSAVVAFSVLPVSAGSASVQALLGAIRYDDFEIKNSDVSGEQTIDISTLPQLGGAWSTAPKGDKIQFGLECSFLLGFSFGSTGYDSADNSSYVRINYDVWTFDLAGGGYVNLFLGEGDKVRIYAAAGPMIMPILTYAEGYENNTNGNDHYYRNNESAFSYGLYARTGIELKVHDAGLLGMGVRGTWVETDLSEMSDLVGFGAFVTYTARL